MQVEASIALNELDPQIAAFIAQMGKGWAQHKALDTVSFPEARHIAEQVRAPWIQGGPQMALTTELAIPFGEDTIPVRIHRPIKDAGALPALVYLHGGGWTIFSINTHDRLMREYASRAGICVIGVDYSLSPEVRFPRALEETIEVVRWLRRHGGEQGIDPDRLATGGDSAGANLAIATAIHLRDAEQPQAVKAMLLNYGAFDTDCHNASYERFGGPAFMLGGQEMEDFWKNYLGEDFGKRLPLACPLHAELSGLPPAFLCIPNCDVLLDENLEMEKRLRAAGVDTTARIYEGASHSFLEAVSIAEVADRALSEASEWLDESLRR
ncbi:alpha/beta hydrolase [Sphingomonas oleivorans]|uniref:Alpha/beta hydrolase n=1 Tax=Sphingomonas oleivorans TaxID=1735121 RepID=A0A2T5FZ02_9SPHN|nr:alpha/beta hydrolase fold domain-containing protein [Sphingomonas oleivorans]PTQ11836.1 alpha/beta hydrolase [Sphingomonas oleivorans]